MRVEHLSLANFRNYRVAELPLGAGAQLFIGSNGQGKTNLIEAIAYFDSLSSHRVSNDAPLIRAGSDTAVMRLAVAVGDRRVTLELELQRGKAKRAQVNGSRVRPTELLQWFTCVVFAPEDVMIARGDPSHRRAFLDRSIATRNPVMAGVFRDYERVLKQRNSLLKSARNSTSRSSITSTLSLWDQQLASLGARIMIERRNFITQLLPRLQTAYSNLVESNHRPSLRIEETAAPEQVDAAGGDPPPVTSHSEGERVSADGLNVSRETLAESFHVALAEVQSAEIERGVTLVGPHRDELVLELNDLPVKGYASHGETWSFTLGLRLAFAELLRDELFTGDPVVILDDVFAELDRRRRERLLQAVGDYEQIIVTAAVAEDIPEPERWRTARIAGGEVVDQVDDQTKHDDVHAER